MQFIAAVLFVFLSQGASAAISVSGAPSLPRTGKGFTGSVGVGFTDFNVISPGTDVKLERGTFAAGSVERGFDFANLYLSLGLAYMNTEGIANYSYTDLSTTTSYKLNDVNFKAQIFELSLGLKLKLIDNYWFRPYVEGGGVGSYNQISYDQDKLSALAATGKDYKKDDVIMGSGYYAEGGVEIEFGPTFGVKIGARQSTVQTKKLDTIGMRPILLQSQTFYFAGLFGF